MIKVLDLVSYYRKSDNNENMANFNAMVDLFLYKVSNSIFKDTTILRGNILVNRLVPQYLDYHAMFQMDLLRYHFEDETVYEFFRSLSGGEDGLTFIVKKIFTKGDVKLVNFSLLDNFNYQIDNFELELFNQGKSFLNPTIIDLRIESMNKIVSLYAITKEELVINLINEIYVEGSYFKNYDNVEKIYLLLMNIKMNKRDIRLVLHKVIFKSAKNFDFSSFLVNLSKILRDQYVKSYAKKAVRNYEIKVKYIIDYLKNDTNI
ncbi:MAG: hypothetical protein WC174_03560 [Bacilli bacterium]